jgi:acylphosphatase
MAGKRCPVKADRVGATVPAREVEMTGTVAVEVRIAGRVQGVSFRAWTRDEARKRGLAGWVRNEADGSVRAHVEGPGDAVEAMLAALYEGPPAASVRRVTVQDAVPEGAAQFGIRR